MTNHRTFDICVLPGDGIGTEVIAATLPLLERLQHGAVRATWSSSRWSTRPAT